MRKSCCRSTCGLLTLPGNLRVSAGATTTTLQLHLDNDHRASDGCADPAGDKVERSISICPRETRARRVLSRIIVSRSPTRSFRNENLLRVWQEHTGNSQPPGINHVLIFENKARRSASRTRIRTARFATNFVFKTIERKRGFRAALAATKRIISMTSSRRSVPTIAASSLKTSMPSPSCRTSRVTLTKSSSRRENAHEPRHTSDEELHDFAAALKNTLYGSIIVADAIPYLMALHQAPTEGATTRLSLSHRFHPPLRRPNLLKYWRARRLRRQLLSDPSRRKSRELRAASDLQYKHAGRKD